MINFTQLTTSKKIWYSILYCWFRWKYRPWTYKYKFVS